MPVGLSPLPLPFFPFLFSLSLKLFDVGGGEPFKLCFQPPLMCHPIHVVRHTTCLAGLSHPRFDPFFQFFDVPFYTA